MTGYGRAEGTQNKAALTVEVRSVNHRYCDIAVRLSKQLASLEDAIKKRIRRRVERGHLDVAIHYDMPLEKSYTLDLPSAKVRYKMLRKLTREFGLPGEITLEQLIHNNDFIVPIDPISRFQTVPPLLGKVLEDALSALDQMCLREGRLLAKEFLTRMRRLSKIVLQIEADQKKGLKDRYQRLLERVEKLTAHPAVDSQRLTQELALLTDRNDISEETSRLKAHFKEFQRLLGEETAVGRALDFLTQEIGREINTIGSKAGDEKISLQVVAMKCEMEKVREQVQNIA